MDEEELVEQVGQPLDIPPVPEPQSAIQKIFRNRFRHWRAGWRILVFAIFLFLGTIGLSALISWLLPEPEGGMMSWGNSLSMAAFNLLIVGVSFLALWAFDRRPLALLGMGFESCWWRELAIGCAAGVVTTGGLTLVLVVTGMVSLEVSPRLAEAVAVMPKYLFLFAMAGAAEELVFRGYILQVLGEGSRRWIAAVLTSLPFAIVHMDNPDVTFTGIANIFLVGLIFAVLYFHTLRLWLPIGFHLSWNWAHGWFWGFDVSGIELPNKVLVATPTGPDLLTGGEFGLEGSILTTVLIVVVGVWLLARNVLTPIPEMTHLWAPYPRGFGMPPNPSQEPDAGGRDNGEMVPENGDG